MTAPDSTQPLDPAALMCGLNTTRVGRRIRVLPRVASTNTYVLDTLAWEQGRAADGTVVFAEYQTAGRGRQGRTWHCPRGAGLIFSLLLWEDARRLTPARAVMAVAVAVVRGIRHATDIDPVIRWPNDIYVGRRKLAGILIETHRFENHACVTAVGVGVNCLQHAGHFPTDIRDHATSLDLESSHPIDRTTVAKAILQQLDAYFADPDRISDDELTNAWRGHSADIGAYVTLDSGGETFTGRIIDVNPQSGLLLHLDTGARREFDPAATRRV